MMYNEICLVLVRKILLNQNVNTTLIALQQWYSELLTLPHANFLFKIRILDANIQKQVS